MVVWVVVVVIPPVVVPPDVVPPPVIPVLVDVPPDVPPVPEGGPGSAELGITYTEAPEHPQYTLPESWSIYFPFWTDQFPIK